MIVYTPFYETLAKRNMTIYQLIYKEGMSANTFQRMKEGKAITTTTIDELCFILKCRVDEIIKYEETNKD
jgi:DNA-binding Xre family transcriptional regulator